MPRPGQQDPAKEKLWRETIAAWQDSGLPRSPFCRKRGIALSTFCGWEAKLRLRSEQVRPDASAAQPQPTRKKKNRKKHFVSAPKAATYADTDSPANFVRVNIESEDDKSPADDRNKLIEITCPNGFLIKLPQSTSTDTVLAILVALSK